MWIPDLSDHSNEDMPLYARIVEVLEADIKIGKLNAGMPLPPQRILAEMLRLSPGTIRRAYQIAGERGLVEGHVGRGTVVRAIDGGRTQATTRRDAALQGEKASPSHLRLVSANSGPQQSDLINLALNEPPEAPALSLIGETMSHKEFSNLVMSSMGYGPPVGFDSHRKTVASWLNTYGRDVEWNRMVLCNGAQHAIRLALGAALEPGDTLLIEDTVYTGLKGIARSMELNLVPVAMDHEGMKPEAMAEAARNTGAKAVYLVPTLHNPTTRTMGRRRRMDIVSQARTHGIMIFEDDVYGMLVPDAPAPLASLAPDLVFYVSGLSKIMCPALRTGILAVPHERWLGSITRQIQSDSLTTASFNTTLACRLIEAGAADSIVEGVAAESAARLKIVRDAFGPDFPLEHGNGGFHVWLPMDRDRADDVVAQALQQSVAVTPPSSVSTGFGHTNGLRLCIGAPRRQDLATGIAILKTMLY